MTRLGGTCNSTLDIKIVPNDHDFRFKFGKCMAWTRLAIV